MYKALDVLAKDVKILGIFSDWPATVTFYANCMQSSHSRCFGCFTDSTASMCWQAPSLTSAS